MRTSVLILLLIATIGAIAQSNYKTVDSTSYALYMQKEWVQLSDYGKKVSDEGFDYYYLNLRVGIANYELGNFYTSEKYLKKAQENYSANKIIPTYLFWIYQQTGREPEAANVFQLMPKSIQKTIKYTPKKIIESIYVELGPKLPNNNNVSGTVFYGNIGLRHQFSPNLNVYHSYTNMQNKLSWGSYNQHQYYIALSFNLKKAWKISAGFNYFNYKSNINNNYIENGILSTTNNSGVRSEISYVFDSNIKGAYNLNAYLAQLNLSKKYKGFTLSPQIGLYREANETNLKELKNTDNIETITQFGQQISTTIIDNKKDTIITTASNNINQTQYGMGLDYTYRFNKNTSLVIGTEIHAILLDSTKFIIVPYFSANFGSKIGLSGYYMSKEGFPVSLFGGSTVINSYDKLNYRLSLTGRFNIFKNTTLFSTFQSEEIEDRFTTNTYKLTSIFIGLQIKF